MKTPENSWGVKLPNGTWDGVTGVMARREADVSNTALVATSARMSAVDFLMPITQLKQGTSSVASIKHKNTTLYYKVHEQCVTLNNNNNNNNNKRRHTYKRQEIQLRI